MFATDYFERWRSARLHTWSNCISARFVINIQWFIIMKQKVKTVFPQGSIPSPLLVSNLHCWPIKNLTSNPKYFADETSLFCVITDFKFSEFNLHNGLNKIKSWEFHWTMSLILISNHRKLFSPARFMKQLIPPYFPIIAQWIEPTHKTLRTAFLLKTRFSKTFDK